MKKIYLRNAQLIRLFDGHMYAQPEITVKINNRGEVMPTPIDLWKVYRADKTGRVLLLTVGDAIDVSAIRTCDLFDVDETPR